MTINNKGKAFGNIENRCRQCKKLFCCSNCRLAHEEKNHSPHELKCPICCSKKFQIKGDESHEFICHLVFHHLPLLCRLCGQSFETCEDLTIIQKCGWWKEENSRRVRKILQETLSPTTITGTKSELLDVNNYIDSCNNNSRKSVSRNKQESNHRFVTLNSPPVLIRNTSTPMISSCLKTNFELRKSNSISFVLKTPRNFSPSLEDTETQQFFDNNEFRKCNSDSAFNSGRYNSQSKSFIQSGSSEYFTCDQQNSRRRLSSLSKVEEFSEPRSRIKKDIKQLKKTVRFSDRFTQAAIEMAEYDEFFEAQESLSEISQKFLDVDKEISVNHVESTFDDTDNRDNRLNFEKENKIFLEESSIYTEETRGPIESNSASENISLMIRNVHLNDNNDNRLDGVANANDLQKKVYSTKNVYLKENINSFNESNIYSQQNEISDDENKENDNSDSSNSMKGTSKISQQAESSQIVMMVVVNNASRISRTDLVPLIDSELKKLEETSSVSSTVYNSISSQSSSSSSSQEEKYSVTNSQFRRKSTTSVNSYFSIASTECFSTQNDSIASNEKENTSYENEESSKSDGILSAMARVVRNALKKLPGGSILQESSESASEKSNTTLAETTSETLSLASSPSLSLSNSPPSPDQSVNNLTSKRPRDAASPSAIIPNPTLPNEDRSPIAKRQRGWYKYKVRARPPIARMRKIQVTSPKGISSETQRFQQGSLSVGRLNTIIPLPSRAHQCTQTEK